ncbi:MAG: DMT family transporter [Actinomycetota bacterium]|nr:DMT family transporter [Actinomycetota bacterium]
MTDRPPGHIVALMGLGILGVSTAAPLIKAAAAPALAIAFWRMALASGVLLPFAAARRERVALGRRELRLTVMAGLLLGAHFAAFVPSVTLTTVASAVALVTMQPAWAALFERLRGARVRAATWSGIALSIAGALLLSGVDLSVSPRALAGDGLALAGGALAAGYRVLGADVRRTVSTTAYTSVCYPVAAAALLAVCLVSGQRLGGYDAATWARLGALAVLAQLLGHSVFNLVVKSVGATMVSLALLFEVVGASVLAAVFLGERPPAAAVPAAVVILAGIWIVVRTREGDLAVGGVPPVD